MVLAESILFWCDPSPFGKTGWWGEKRRQGEEEKRRRKREKGKMTEGEE